MKIRTRSNRSQSAISLLTDALASAALLLSVSIVQPNTIFGGDAAVLSGTIEYTGSQGPVSAERPILLLLWDNFDLEGEPIAGTAVESNGGAFELMAPAPGNYFLAYILDTNGDALPNVGDPFEIYLDRFSTAADPIAVPQSDVVLSFDDTGALPGVRGTVTYTGALGPVSETSPLRVEVFRNGDLTDPLDQEPRLTENGGAYQVILLASRLHFLQAYLDLNDNGQRDFDEPFTIYNNRSAPFGDPLPQGVADLDISFGDGGAPTPTPEGDVLLSGTIEYTGERGPVSAQRPITLVLLSGSGFDSVPVAITAVDTNGGEFVLAAPAPGEYYLSYLLNTNAGGPPNVGDPFEVYLDRFAPPADPLTLPQSGLALSFDDTGSLPGVTGTATYTGSLGPVSETRPIVIHVFRDADLTDRLIETRFIVENGGSFGLILFESIEHFVMAFLDLNQNEERDEGEPFTIYDGRATPPGDPIPEDGSMLEITFGDEGLPTPTSTPTATATPTPETSCVGDCNNDGEVTVDELVIGASIALGVADLSECPEFDADSNGSVTVDELLQSVANLLGGCPDN